MRSSSYVGGFGLAVCVLLVAGAGLLLIHGVGQINVLIPRGVAPGDAVPVEVTIGENASQPGITVAVGPTP